MLVRINDKFKYILVVILTNMVSKKQINTFKQSADAVYSLKDYTSSTILYFKTIFAIHDFLLLKKSGLAPKDHKERFRMLEKHFPDLYDELDSEFNTYRNTYSRTTSKETCNRIKLMIENAYSKYIL